MKKIINGKKYDTDTAASIAEASWGGGYSDFHWTSETLYKKRTGEYFLFGEGGPASGYAKNEGFGWCAGEEIRPMTEAEAKDWAEQHMDADDYEAAFGPVPE